MTEDIDSEPLPGLLGRRRGARGRLHTVADEMIDRSLRLELAAALRLTEYAAGDLLARSTATLPRSMR